MSRTTNILKLQKLTVHIIKGHNMGLTLKLIYESINSKTNGYNLKKEKRVN